MPRVKNVATSAIIFLLWEINCLSGRWDPWQIFKRDLCRAALLIGWEVLGSEVTQLKGVVGILDLSGCSLAHISKLASPLKMQKMMNLFKVWRYG